MCEPTTPLTRDEAIALFDALPPDLLAKAEFILDVFIQCEQAELEAGDE